MVEPLPKLIPITTYLIFYILLQSILLFTAPMFYLAKFHSNGQQFSFLTVRAVKKRAISPDPSS